MQLVWGNLKQKNKNRLKAGWLMAAGLSALYIATTQTHGGVGVAQSTGLAAFEPISLWRQPLYSRAVDAIAREGRSQPAAAMTYLSSAIPQAPEADRKTVVTSSMNLVAKSPADTADKIRQLTERLGGFLVSSATSGEQDASFATLTIRVPTARFDEARAEIRKMGLRVESERVEALDVTKQYVDMDARLRNLRVEEAQYLSIMKRASTVKDTLEVSGRLSNVRGQIEQQQAEFNALSKQVETVAIAVELRAEADAQVFGLHWRPLYQLKRAARDGLSSLASYVASMVSFVFLLPTILLWLTTILLGAAFGWRILRWAGRTFFGLPQPAPAAGQ